MANFAVSTTFGSQRGEILKSNFPTITAARSFAESFLKAQEKRIEKEGGIIPIIQIWQMLDTLN